MGVPAYQIKDLVSSHGVAVFSSNYTLYGDMSGRVMSILAGLAPELEVYSIDEAFINLDGVGYSITWNKNSKPGNTWYRYSC